MTENRRRKTKMGEVFGQVKQIFCQSCLNREKQTIAKKFCQTCNEFQCNECSNVHNVLLFLKNHKLVDAEEANASRLLLDMKGFDRCDQHKKPLEFYCDDDNTLCCSTCAILDHRKCHIVVEIEQIAEEMTTLSSRLEEKLQKTKEKAESIARHILSAKDQLAQDVNDLLVKIGGMRDEVMKLFDNLELFVVNRAESLQEKTLIKLTEKQSQNENYLAYVTECLERIDSINKNGNHVQKFIVEQKMENEVNILCRNVREEYQNLQTVSISFDFDKTLRLPPLPVDTYVPGQLLLKSYQRDDSGSDDTAISLTLVSSIDLKAPEDDIYEPLYSGIDFLFDGRLVAVDNSNNKCLVYNQKLEEVGIFDLTNRPQSVVAVSDEVVAITSGDKYEIEFLHITKSNKITSCKRCKVQTKYDSICLKDDRQYVVGTIGHKRHARIVSLTCEEYDLGIDFENKIFPIDSSYCTYISNSDKVVLTDRDEHTVFIYDIETNTSVPVIDDRIQEPCGAAVGPADTILVCSHNTNAIVQVSQTGRILSSHDMDIDLPYRACVSHDKSFLAVTNTCVGNKKLQKFKIS
ncbi:uncharacterized protein LOC132753396 [Ruditapes philippinarum]|uniref:uncharacterized protein LOC132753396 n=1 Tax=Ruditapes philippinarum TaxID=129788 RepID=UPI00295B9774|nr:uncharacterized protein LOC132753396 [Ruditapes philippinarum]